MMIDLHTFLAPLLAVLGLAALGYFVRVYDDRNGGGRP